MGVKRWGREYEHNELVCMYFCIHDSIYEHVNLVQSDPISPYTVTRLFWWMAKWCSWDSEKFSNQGDEFK